MAEFADDRVSASGHDGAADNGQARRWREIEVELGPGGSEELLRLLSKRLTRSGARLSATQVKLDRALGPVNQPADGAPSALVARYLSTQVAEVLRGDIGLRMGSDPEPVHDLRVASRRIRSIVREYRAVLSDPASEISSELQWLGEILGEIRDLDVLADTVKADIVSLPAELVLGPVVTDLEEAVAKDRAAAIERWQRERDGDRYRRLMATWSSGCTHLRCWTTPSPGSSGSSIRRASAVVGGSRWPGRIRRRCIGLGRRRNGSGTPPSWHHPIRSRRPARRRRPSRCSGCSGPIRIKWSPRPICVRSAPGTETRPATTGTRSACSLLAPTSTPPSCGARCGNADGRDVRDQVRYVRAWSAVVHVDGGEGVLRTGTRLPRCVLTNNASDRT